MEPATAPTEVRYDIQKILRDLEINDAQLAKWSNVHPSTIASMREGHRVRRSIANRVLKRGLSRYLNADINLDNSEGVNLR